MPRLSSSMISHCEAEAVSKLREHNPDISTLVGEELLKILDTIREMNEIHTEKLEELKPPASEYERLDLPKTFKKYLGRDKSSEDIAKAMCNNVVFGTMNGANKIEVYEVYKKKDADEVYCIIKFGNKVSGYPGVVHGGITSLLFDQNFGNLMASAGLPPAVTANLTVNYRGPVFAGSWAIMRTKVDHVRGRKQFMSATLHDVNGGTPRLLAECTSLFVEIKRRE